MKNPHADKISKVILQLGQVYSVWNVFSDFCELSSLAVANSCEMDKEAHEKRETRYKETIGKYSQEAQAKFPEMFADLVEALQYELTWENAPTDVLGAMFHELELHNKYAGQFFTPQHICDMMGKISLGENGEEQLKEKGYFMVNEPCCGSGAMVLGFVRAMFEQELNYCTQCVVLATDLDLKCVHMCYLQLSLYGIPAVVVHGNTLTLEEYSHWITPVYIFHGWPRRIGILSNIDRTPKEQEEPKQLSIFEEDESNAR